MSIRGKCVVSCQGGLYLVRDRQHVGDLLGTIRGHGVDDDASHAHRAVLDQLVQRGRRQGTEHATALGGQGMANQCCRVMANDTNKVLFEPIV